MPARPLLVVAVALVLALSGCGDDDTSGTPQPTATPTVSPSASPSPTESGAPPELLTVGDVGTSWKPGSEVNADDLAAFAQSPCSTAVEPDVAGRLTAVAGTQFEPVDGSRRHLIELVVTGTPATLDADLGALFDAIDACPGAASPGPGRLTVTRLAIPELGDQRRAYAVLQSGGSSSSSVYVRNVYVRAGSVAVMLGLADFEATTAGGSQISDATVEGYVRTAVEKLGA